MKRAGNLYREIPLYSNLCLAFHKAARGKRNRPEVRKFNRDFNSNIETLGRQIIQKNLDIGHYRFFHVRDPKPRNICAASFPERVLHHAVMNVCEPMLESFSIFDSYACRKGKGNRKALDRAQYFAGKYVWYLKLDVKKYFDSIDHNVLIRLLEKRFKDRDLLEFFGKIFNTYHTAPGKGMPIGNLISQHLANFYLGGFDHWIKEVRKVKGYVRYMDDFLLFGNDKSAIQRELVAVREYLGWNLGLKLKDNIQLNRCIKGFGFLGFRVYPHMIRLSAASKKRFIDKFRRYEKKWINGEWSIEELTRHVEPLIAFTTAGDTIAFRREIIHKYGVSF
jgi:hypothetical protein